MRIATFVGVWLAVVLVGAGAAMACTTPNWITVEPAGTTSGGEVTLQGGGYEAGPVDLRWGGLDGDLLATAEAGPDGRIEAEVTVPEAEPGRSRIVGVQDAADGTRLWGFADVEVEAVPAALLDGWRIGAAALALLVLAALAVWLRSVNVRRRAASSQPDVSDEAPVDVELAGLLEDDEEAAPVGGRS